MRAFAPRVLIALRAPASAGAETYGESAAGRPLQVDARRDPAAPIRVLVVGSIHGNEPAGHAVVRHLRGLAPPAGVQLRPVERRQSRRGARGHAPERPRRRPRPQLPVPLGRRRARAFDTYFPGPRRGVGAGDPRAAAAGRRRASRRSRVYYHQHMRLAALPRPGRPRARPRVRPARRAAGTRRLPPLPRHRDQLAEPSRDGHPRVRGRAAGRAALAAAPPDATPRAVLAIASAAPAAVSAAAAPEPPIDWDPIPFRADRRRQMRAYSRRHYGDAEAKLADPKVIVEHYTASTKLRAPPSTRSRATRLTSSSASAPASAPTS